MDDDVYQDRQDQTVTVAFTLTADDSLAANKNIVAELAGVEALAWTTTPWTLPTNQALAVGPDIEYVVVPGAGELSGRRFLIAADLLGTYAKDLGYAGESPAEDAAAAVTAPPHRLPTRRCALHSAVGLLRRCREMGHRNLLADSRCRLREYH